MGMFSIVSKIFTQICFCFSRANSDISTSNLKPSIPVIHTTENVGNHETNTVSFDTNNGTDIINTGRLLSLTKQKLAVQGNILLSRFVGSGSYGKVYEARMEKSRQKLAVKVVALSKIQETRGVDMLRKEVENHIGLCHPNIIRCFGAYLDSNQAYILLELATGGDLFDAIDCTSGMDEKIAARIVRDISRGLCYCHSNGIVHCDVKPENILFGADGNAKLADFGMSVRTSGYGISRGGTAGYMAPEHMNGSVGASSDFWSLGVSLFKMFYLSYPFCPEDKNVPMKLGKIPDKPKLSWAAKQVTRGLLRRYPDRRFGAKQVLRSSWIRKFN